MTTNPARQPARTPLERAPVLQLGEALIPAERYTSASFAEREWSGLWQRTWLLAAFEADLREPGDYTTFEIGPESILLVKLPSGEVAARYNVCMHRGNRLREPGRGWARQFACAYHDWRYDLDGTLLAPQDPERFPQGCPAAALSLRAVSCERWGGFVFVCLGEDPMPLREYLGVLPAHLDPYHFEEMSIVGDYTIEVPCNWKTSVDAFNEAYHIAGTHPDTLPVNDDVDVPIDCYERHSRMILKLAVSSPRLDTGGEIHDMIREAFLRTAGIDPEGFDGGPEDVRQGPALGADFSDLHDAQLVDDFHYTMFPNVTFNIFGRSAWLFRHRPHERDPERMYFDFFNLVRAPAAGMPRAEHEHHLCRDDLVLDVLGGGGELLAQDAYNLPRIQAGMRSAGFPGLHLGEQELRIRHFHDTLMRYVDGAP